MDAAEKGAGTFVVSGGDGAIVFEFGEEVFDQMPPCILVFVKVPLVCAVGFWRYDALDLGPLKQSENPFPGIMGFIGQKRLNMIKNTGQQHIGAVKITGLSRRQVKAGRVARSITRRMDFRGQPPF